MWPAASSATVRELVRTSSVVEQAHGPLLVHGERPSRVVLVLSGTFVGTWTAPDGRVANGSIVRVDPDGPGRFVGVSTLSGAPIISGIDALTPVKMLVWPSDRFRAVAEKDLAVSLDLLDRTIDGIHALNRLMQLRTFTTAAGRLAAVLLQYEAVCFGERPTVPRGQLSALAGVTPQMVGRIIRRWESEGILRRIGSTGLELLDRSGLEANAPPATEFPPSLSNSPERLTPKG